MRNNRRPLSRGKRYALTAALLALAGLLLAFSARELGKKPVIIISEVCSANRSVLADEEGGFRNFIELYNAGEISVNLRDWYLSDNDNKPLKWKFPDSLVLAPGEYAVVFASGKNKRQADGVYHTNFGVSRDGEPVLLSNASGVLVSRTGPFEGVDNTSYAWIDDLQDYAYLAFPTPGLPNTGVYALTPDELRLTPDDGDGTEPGDAEPDAPKVYIMEYMSANHYYLPDEDGDFSGWAELYNPGAEAVDLSGFMMSNKEAKPDKWAFPGGTAIGPGERLVLRLSGKSREGHAGFKLSKSSDCLLLSDRLGRPVDKAPVVFPRDHVSYGRDENKYDNWLFFPRPTPGLPNTTEGFADLGGVSALDWRGLYIAEASHNNWVELGNATGQPIQASGWHLSDSSKDLTRMALPDTVVEPGQTLRVDTAFGIRNRGETLYLTDSDGSLRDYMHTGSLKAGVTSGRTVSTGDTRVYFKTGASGGTDKSHAYTGYAGEVRADTDDGYVVSGTRVTLTVIGIGAIRYTLDGTEPNEHSPVYTAPLVITKHTPLRARAFADGYLPGHILTRTYLTGDGHTLPVVHITTDPDNLFGHQNGIFADGPGWTPEFPHLGANFWKGWERPVHFAYYNEAGQLCAEADAGVQTFGQYSRAEKQKAMSIHFRKDYGQNRVAYPFFPGNGVTEFGSLVLRASGQDWNITHLRDAFMTTAIKDEMTMDSMDARPVVLYINGEYWGLYHLREKINENYFETRYGVAKDDIDIIKGNSIANAGSNKEYVAFVDGLSAMDTTTNAAYEYIRAHMDVESWMDFWIAETFFVNTDSGNIKCWKPQSGGKWRWVIFDLDWGLLPATYQDYPISRMIDAKGHGVGKNFSTRIARAVLKNARLRDEFAERYLYHLDHTFQPDRMIGVLDAYADQIRAEMPGQIERWGGPASMTGWERNLERVRTVLRERPDAARAELDAIRKYRGS